MISPRHSYFLRPLDTLFFRGGEPFNAGDDHFVQSQFPPTPRTLQGIVRTRLLQQAGIDLNDRDAIGSCVGSGDDLPEDVQIQGPFPAFRGESWFPAPRYLVQDSKEVWQRLSPRDGLLNDLELPLPAYPSAGFLKPVGGWLAWPLMRWALWDKGTPNPSHWSENDAPWEEELRTGIAREPKSKTAATGHLYSIGHIRLKPQAALWFQTTRELTPGVMPVGGEGRVAAFEKATAPGLKLPDDVAQAIYQDGRFWLVLVQPARFQGWRPAFTVNELEGLEVNLLTAVVGKPQPIGGFDLVNQRPANLYRYVPAGSAYLLELAKPAPRDTPARLQRLHDACVLGEPRERRMGFGHIMIGRALDSFWSGRNPDES